MKVKIRIKIETEDAKERELLTQQQLANLRHALKAQTLTNIERWMDRFGISVEEVVDRRRKDASKALHTQV